MTHRNRESEQSFEVRLNEIKDSIPPHKRIKPGASCGTCQFFRLQHCSNLRSPHCALKKKAVQPYNVCEHWEEATKLT